MTDEELAELRALQARAYGVGGGLIGAELSRLRDLERFHRVVRGRPALPRPEAEAAAPLPDHSTSPSTGSGSGTGLRGAEVSSDGTGSYAGPSTDSGSGDGRSGGGDSGSGSGGSGSPFPLPEPVEGEAASPTGDAGRRRTAVVASVAGAALLAVGIAIGAALFAPTPVVVGLTEAQQELEQIIRQDDQFLPGSVRAVIAEEEAAAWTASDSADKMLCLIVGIDLGWSHTCGPTDEVHRTGIAVMHDVPGADGVMEVVQVQVMFTPDGEPAANLHRFVTGEQPEPIFENEQERADHAALVDAGFTSNEIWRVGSYGGRTVWVGQHSLNGQCLATVADDGPVFGCQDTDAFGRLSLTLPPADLEADPLTVVTMEYSVNRDGQSTLTISEVAAENTTVHSETGQSIGTGDQADHADGSLTGP